MVGFILRALGFGLFWFCAFSVKNVDGYTYFEVIHRVNADMVDWVDRKLDGK